MIDLYNNNLPPDVIAEEAMRLVGVVGEDPSRHEVYFTDRAGRGWCAAEIARAYVRSRYSKSDPFRRLLLNSLSRLGAKAGQQVR